MDKIIEKKTGWRTAFTKKALPWWLGALLLAFIVYLIARPNNKTLRPAFLPASGECPESPPIPRGNVSAIC